MPAHGFKIACGDARAEAATADAIKRLALVPAIKRAGSLARLYGGALVVLGVDDGQAPDLPVIPANVRRITHATPIACVELSVHSRYEDPLGPRYGLPSLYRVNRGAGALVHASRVLRFEGASVTDRRRQQLQGWGERFAASVRTAQSVGRGLRKHELRSLQRPKASSRCAICGRKSRRPRRRDTPQD